MNNSLSFSAFYSFSSQGPRQRPLRRGCWRDGSLGAAETIGRSQPLRLPSGIFYAQGVKANVLFDRKPASKKPCIYDLRTNHHFNLKEKTLKRSA